MDKILRGPGAIVEIRVYDGAGDLVVIGLWHQAVEVPADPGRVVYQVERCHEGQDELDQA